MKKVIRDKVIHFYDAKNNEIMYIDFSCDDCVWYFYSDDIINISMDMELYHLIDKFMNQHYEFNSDILIDYKDCNRLIWYSDCYYNPDDAISVSAVSCLNIERIHIGFKIWCTKKLDEIINRPNKSQMICFSPAGNGKYSKNVDTGSTLQDDFVTYIYQPLLNRSDILKKQIKIY